MWWKLLLAGLVGCFIGGITTAAVDYTAIKDASDAIKEANSEIDRQKAENEKLFHEISQLARDIKNGKRKVSVMDVIADIDAIIE